MEKVRIHPERLEHFGAPGGCSFVLLTNSKWLDRFEFDLSDLDACCDLDASCDLSGSEAAGESSYRERRILPFDEGDDIEALLREIPEPAHVLVIAPECYFRSPSPRALGPRRKLSVMACNSTPTSIAAIEHFLRMGERMQPAEQDALAAGFFEGAEAAKALHFVDPVWGTEAVFDHRREDVQWHEQVGALDWGGQQLFPAGEISVLPVGLYDDGVTRTLGLDGSIALQGQPVLHSGSVSFLPADQQRIYERLLALREGAAVATLEGGRIMAIEAATAAARPAVEMLETLFEMDSRYRVMVEIGFSVNTTLELFPGNAAMNEVSGQAGGTVHWGLGLLPYTQYHLDVLSPGTRVRDEAGRALFANPGEASTRRRIVRQGGASCPCIEGR